MPKPIVQKIEIIVGENGMEFTSKGFSKLEILGALRLHEQMISLELITEINKNYETTQTIDP